VAFQAMLVKLPACLKYLCGFLLSLKPQSGASGIWKASSDNGQQ